MGFEISTLTLVAFISSTQSFTRTFSMGITVEVDRPIWIAMTRLTLRKPKMVVNATVATQAFDVFFTVALQCFATFNIF